MALGSLATESPQGGNQGPRLPALKQEPDSPFFPRVPQDPSPGHQGWLPPSLIHLGGVGRDRRDRTTSREHGSLADHLLPLWPGPSTGWDGKVWGEASWKPGPHVGMHPWGLLPCQPGDADSMGPFTPDLGAEGRSSMLEPACSLQPGPSHSAPRRDAGSLPWGRGAGSCWDTRAARLFAAARGRARAPRGLGVPRGAGALPESADPPDGVQDADPLLQTALLPWRGRPPPQLLEPRSPGPGRGLAG